MTTNIVDPWESAEQAKEPTFSNLIWGQVEASSWWCVLEKGVGKMEFDPKVHKPEQRRTAIDIVVHPLNDMGLEFDLTRNMIAESREWAGIVLPSIRDLGLSPKQLDRMWVKIQTEPLTDKSGNVVTYTDRNGIVKEKTTVRFLAAFAKEEECRADYLQNSGKSAQLVETGNNGNNGNNEDKERETAQKFLRVYVLNACRGQTDLEIIRKTLELQIAAQPLISKYFTIDSPETVNLITEYMAPF